MARYNHRQKVKLSPTDQMAGGYTVQESQGTCKESRLESRRFVLRGYVIKTGRRTHITNV